MSAQAQETQAATLGRLFLVPAPLDFGCEQQAPLTDVLPQATLQQAAQLTHWISENAKTCRAYLKRIDACFALAAPLQEQAISELPRHVHKKGDHTQNSNAPQWDARSLLAPLLAGRDMGLVSEAGMPAVADPGSSVVRAAHDLGAQVVPLVGPVSLLLALAASGLNGQSFAFQGYVPQEASARAQRIRALFAQCQASGQAQVLIETPYRNPALWQALLQTLPAQARLAVASGLTLPQAHIASRSVQAWKRLDWAPDKHTPTVYAFGL